MKRISIVIATWNAAETIKSCLDSIIPQITSSCELIVIDGGSTDSTNDIISSYGDKISYTISEKDKGIYDAWNKGINVSKGEWIAFVGADDMLYPDAIEKYLNVLDNTPDIKTYDYISAKNDFVNNEGRILRIIGDSASWDNMKKKNAIAHVASLHNKHNLFESIGCFNNKDYHISADYELLIRKKNKLKYLFLNEHIARMKIGGMSFSVKALVEVYRIRKEYHTVSQLENIILFIWDVILLKTFLLRKRIEIYI